MSRTLTLIDDGWDSARALANRGQRAPALAQLTRLLTRPDTPAALLAEGHRMAGELALELERYATARRHLKAAVALEPDNARVRYAMGLAWQDDPNGCDRRAAICFKKAAALDAANPRYRAAFGRAAARCGKVKRGVREMLAAAELAPGNLEVIRVIVGGLLELGRAREARQVVATARFLCPGNSELGGLCERVKFESARIAQLKTTKAAKIRGNTRPAQDAHFATDGDRVTLPFVRLASDTDSSEAGPKAASAGGTVRRDTVSFPRPHFPRLQARNADR